MEGIILELEALVSPWAIIGGISLLAVVARAVAAGYMAEEEKAGRRFFWAEWPIPGCEETSIEEKKVRLAA
jgi:hypothetical protein